MRQFSFFPTWTLFIPFSCLTALARTSSTVLNKVGGEDILILFLVLGQWGLLGDCWGAGEGAGLRERELGPEGWPKVMWQVARGQDLGAGSSCVITAPWERIHCPGQCVPWEDPGEGLPGGGAPLFKPEPVSSSRGQPHETISGGGWSGHEKDLSARFGEETNYQPEVVAGWGWGTVLRAGHSCIHSFNRHWLSTYYVLPWSRFWTERVTVRQWTTETRNEYITQFLRDFLGMPEMPYS